jgi:hypothetical protein
VWLGGSILASLPAFQAHWLLNHEYDEMGPVLARAGVAPRPTAPVQSSEWWQQLAAR